MNKITHTYIHINTYIYKFDFLWDGESDNQNAIDRLCAYV